MARKPSILDCGGKAAAATPLSRGRKASENSGDFRADESGVALRFPPQSKKITSQATLQNHPTDATGRS